MRFLDDATWSCKSSLSLFAAKPFDRRSEAGTRLGKEDAAADGDCCADAAVEGPKATHSEVGGIGEEDTAFTYDTGIFLHKFRACSWKKLLRNRTGISGKQVKV